MSSQIQAVSVPGLLRGDWSSAITIPLEFDVIEGKCAPCLFRLCRSTSYIAVSLAFSAEDITLECYTPELNQIGYVINVEWSSHTFPSILTDIIESYNVFTSDDLEVRNLPRQV